MKKIEATKIDLPEQIKRHLIKLIMSSGLPVIEEALDEYIYSWEHKERMIENEIDKFNLKEVDFIEQNDEREIIVMTYSGSIIRMSEPIKNTRNLEYYSIQSRDDVPQKLTIKKAQLAYDIIKKEEMFSKHFLLQLELFCYCIFQGSLFYLNKFQKQVKPHGFLHLIK